MPAIPTLGTRRAGKPGPKTAPATLPAFGMPPALYLSPLSPANGIKQNEGSRPGAQIMAHFREQPSTPKGQRRTLKEYSSNLETPGEEAVNGKLKNLPAVTPEHY
jgi:hypothetical protein